MSQLPVLLMNLNFDTTDEGLREAFAKQVKDAGDFSIAVWKDADNQKSRGFAVATVPDDKVEAFVSQAEGIKVDGREVRLLSGVEVFSVVGPFMQRNREECPPGVDDALRALAQRVRAAQQG
jgi:hypothetical protein